MSDNFALLQQAIDRCTPIQLAIPSAAMTRNHKSRLIALRDDSILLESVEGAAEGIDALIKSAQPLSVTFRSDTQNVEFSAPVLERIPNYALNDTTRIEVISLSRPTAIKAVQRRSDYRVSISQDSEISFKFWRISEQDEFLKAPAATAMMTVDVRDFSAGGIGGTWKRRKEEPPSLVSNQRLRVEITSAQCNVALDARLRFIAELNDPCLFRVGVQFTFVPTSLPDRQKMATLNKVLGELQRQELRRLKIAR